MNETLATVIKASFIFLMIALLVFSGFFFMGKDKPLLIPNETKINETCKIYGLSPKGYTQSFEDNATYVLCGEKIGGIYNER